MSEENIIVLCCQCGCHFKKSETRKLKIENVPINLHICNSCLDSMPELSEHVEPTLKKA